MRTKTFHNLNFSTQALFITDFLILFFIHYGISAFNLYSDDIPSITLINPTQLGHTLLFVLPIQLSQLSLGLYNRRLRESFRGIVRRLFAALIVSYLILAFIYAINDSSSPMTKFFELSYLLAFFSLCSMRYLNKKIQSEYWGRKRVVVVGAGERASIIEQRLRRASDRVAFDLLGFIEMPGDSTQNIKPEKIIKLNIPLEQYILNNQIDEIIIAADERRNNLQVDCLFQCKLHGIAITDIIDFIERESGQIAVNLIYPSWVIYSNGFRSDNYLRSAFDYLFNNLTVIIILTLTWPAMLITAILIKLEEGIAAPVLYAQERIGINGKIFRIYKFRSMRIDAEKNGAVWAQKQDPRVTRVGKVIRKYRIDELPQLYNVLKGDMGFIGPRPERPSFVKQLIKDIPYYNQRHSVKPGLTGWAQLKYPYGSSESDAFEKLKFDLYYIKHRSLLLDLLILLRTAEIVLFGKGR